jgi:hypothetical protein
VNSPQSVHGNHDSFATSYRTTATANVVVVYCCLHLPVSFACGSSKISTSPCVIPPCLGGTIILQGAETTARTSKQPLSIAWHLVAYFFVLFAESYLHQDSNPWSWSFSHAIFLFLHRQSFLFPAGFQTSQEEIPLFFCPLKLLAVLDIILAANTPRQHLPDILHHLIPETSIASR